MEPQGVLSWLFGGGGGSVAVDDEEDEQHNPPRLPLQQNHHTVIPLNQGNEEGGAHGEEIESETESYSNEYSGSNEDEHIMIDSKTRQWIDHIVKVTRDLYPEEPADMIRLVYRTFAQAYPTQAGLNLDALQYIRDPAEYNAKAPQQGLFRCLFYSTLIQELKDVHRHEASKSLFGVAGVFLVNKQLDFIYGRVIECALLHDHDGLSRAAYDAFKLRKRITRPCVNDHEQSEHGCPSDWLLYVNVSSPFYTFCSKLLKEKIPFINFGLTTHYIETERLSFYLVLFLCGDLMGEQPASTDEWQDLTTPLIHSAQYTEINQWKKLPIWFLGLWYAGHPDQQI